MLKTLTTELEPSYIFIEPNTIQQRWHEIQEGVCALIDSRLSDSTRQWYQEELLATKYEFLDTIDIGDSSDLYGIPEGYIAEFFFMQACNNLGLVCTETGGDLDAMGADFFLTAMGETRFLDVTINTSDRGLRRKNKEGTFPTLFIPWNIPYDGRKQSYLEYYLDTGIFDSEAFLNEILDYNYRNLHLLKKSVWSDCKTGEGYMSLNGIQYIKNLEGILLLIRTAMRLNS